MVNPGAVGQQELVGQQRVLILDEHPAMHQGLRGGINRDQGNAVDLVVVPGHAQAPKHIVARILGVPPVLNVHIGRFRPLDGIATLLIALALQCGLHMQLGSGAQWGIERGSEGGFLGALNRRCQGQVREVGQGQFAVFGGAQCLALNRQP